MIASSAIRKISLLSLFDGQSFFSNVKLKIKLFRKLFFKKKAGKLKIFDQLIQLN